MKIAPAEAQRTLYSATSPAYFILDKAQRTLRFVGGSCWEPRTLMAATNALIPSLPKISIRVPVLNSEALASQRGSAVE
jgi:hypothetical protein